jgi:hypothetical protein
LGGDAADFDFGAASVDRQSQGLAGRRARRFASGGQGYYGNRFDEPGPIALASRKAQPPRSVRLPPATTANPFIHLHPAHLPEKLAFASALMLGGGSLRGTRDDTGIQAGTLVRLMARGGAWIASQPGPL